MIAAVQALVAPLIAAAEARFTLAATLMIRRAVFLIAAALFGIGALVFLSVAAFFALVPGIGPGGAALVLALIWALLAGFCAFMARLRPRPVVVAPRVTAPAPPPPPPPPPVYPHAAAGAPPVAPVAPAGPASRLARLRTRVSRAAPLLALGALVAGIVAGRR